MKPAPIKESNYIQPNNKDLFEIFKHNNTVDWTTDKILDFGCNVGNYVSNAGTNITPHNYLGIDLNLPSIEQAKLHHHRFNFLHYNKWHPSYNPTGIPDLKVTDFVNEKFDVVIAYSVFTHLSLSQAKQEIDNLLKVLVPGGQLLFTIWSSEMFQPFYCWMYERYNIVEIDFSTVKYNKVAYWLNDRDIVLDQEDINSNCNSVRTYYQTSAFLKLFPNARILGIPPGQHQTLVQITNPGVTRGLD
jgi:2-polyprenyl-3-methyl-5-hydroxy-6-metoxy-1,4-benzoquinol methylase